MIAKCPYCQFAYTIGPEHLGLQSVCQNCNNNFVIEEDKPQPAPAPQAPPRQAPAQQAAAAAAAAQAGLRQQAEAPAEKGGWLSRTMGKAKAKKAPKTKEKPPKAAPAEAGAAAADGGKWRKIALAFIALFALALAGAAYVYLFMFQPAAAKVTSLANENQSVTARLNSATKRVNELQQDQGDLEALKAQRAQLAADVDRYQQELAYIQPNAWYYPLAAALASETKLLDTQVLARINAIEGGAKADLSSVRSKPDPNLAAELEGQMTTLASRITLAERELAGIPADDVEATQRARLALTIDRLTLATLRRNQLAAKFGLSLIYNIPDPAPQQ